MDLAVAQRLAWAVGHPFMYFLAGSSPFGGVAEAGLSRETVAGVIRALPPLVDIDQVEVGAQLMAADPEDETEIEVGLRDPDGVVHATVVLRCSARWDDGLRMARPTVALVGFRGDVPAPRPASHRADGKLLRSHLVGSDDLCLTKLIVAMGDRRVSDEQYAVRAIDDADGDIYNGSLHQFYSNSTGDFASRFPAFASKIGALEKAAAVELGNRLFEGVDLEDWAARNDRLDAFTAEDELALDQATDRYYGADEHIRELLIGYVRANVDTFLA